MTENRQDESASSEGTARVTRGEFELACIREFSHSGHHVGLLASRHERRERIRAAILRENKIHERWHHSSYTYAEVFAQAYQQPLAAPEAGAKLLGRQKCLAESSGQLPDDIDDIDDKKKIWT